MKLCWVHPLILRPHRSAEASLCRREAGEREKESPGEDGKGKEQTRTQSLFKCFMG